MRCQRRLSVLIAASAASLTLSSGDVRPSLHPGLRLAASDKTGPALSAPYIEDRDYKAEMLPDPCAPPNPLPGCPRNEEPSPPEKQPPARNPTETQG